MKKFFSFVVVISMLLVLFTVRPTTLAVGGFSDVPGNYWAKEQIDYLVSKKIVAGFPDGSFKPELGVTREQFAKMIVIAKGLSEYKPSKQTFKDVSKDRWSYGYIEAAAKAGYIKGYTNGSFGPNDPITREQLAVLLIRVLGKESAANESNLIIATFSNDEREISSWAKGAVTLAVRPEFQLLKWDDNRNIRPKDASTRAECAYSVYMVLKPPVVGGTLNIGITQEPKTLFKMLWFTTASTAVLWPMRDGATGVTPTGIVYPVGAEYIPNVKDGTWQINSATKTMKTVWKLRKGVKWSDGVPVTSADYAFTYQMYTNPQIQKAGADVTSLIDKIETPDQYTIIVYWKSLTPWAVYGPLGAVFGDAAEVYPAHILKPIYDKNPADINTCDFNNSPVYAGPYKIAEWKKGSYIYLKRNENYWAGKPLLDNVVFHILPDQNTMLMQLLTGQLDYTVPGLGLEVPQAYSAEQKGLKNTFDFYYIPSYYMEHITLNTQDPILKDPTLRQAMLYALDRDNLTQMIFMGKRQVAEGYISQMSPAFNKNLVGKYKYNPTKAKEMLRDAGYTWDKNGSLINPDGKKVEITIEGAAGNQVRAQEIEFCSKYWKDNLGITVYYLPKTWSVMWDDMVHAKSQGTIFAHPTLPPDVIDYPTYNSSQIPTEQNGWQGQNYSRISDQELDKWTTIGNDNFFDQQKLYEASKNLQARVYELVPEIYLNFFVSVSVVRKGFVGFDYPVDGAIVGTWNLQYWYKGK
jgi:peptide/nickel transport system substrate-binding protein